MAHAIIFVDRAPRTRELELATLYYTHFAGAAKIASELRKKGMQVLVVPNCMNLSFAGIKQIVENNKENLLWVGLSTTLMGMSVTTQDQDHYHDVWAKSSDLVLDIDFILKKSDDILPRNAILYNNKVLGKISHLLQSKYNVPFMIGGAAVDTIQTSGPLVHPNMHVVRGYAETYTKKLTESLTSVPRRDIPYVVNNTDYDNNQFKHDQIYWEDSDIIEPNDWLPLEIARGCAFNCAYCNYPQRSKFDAYRHADSLKEELIRNYEKFGVTKYMLVDDLYNDSKEKVRFLYDEVWSRLPFKPEWVSFMRLDMIWADPDSAEIIKASGARYGGFGIETLHDQAGKKIGKGLGKQRIIETLQHLKQVWGDQVLVGACMISGLPYEPLDSINETIDWTMNTDLIHGANWQVLNLLPPSLSKLPGLQFSDISPIHVTNSIDKDPGKYGITWIDKYTWVNSAGVTNKQAADVIKRYKTKNPWARKFNQYNYADARSSGLTHQQIANIHTDDCTVDLMDQAVSINKTRIQQRLLKILNIKM